MRISSVLLIIIRLVLESYGQEKPILVFDLINDTVNEIPNSEYDTTVLNDQTDYYIGNFNSEIEFLEEETPIANIYPDSNFTYKKQASIDFDLTNYPIRTAVKLFSVENDALAHLCSGIFISQKHVLTAAHCVSSLGTNRLHTDAIKAYPVFDNGVSNNQFSPSFVKKIYLFKDWDFLVDDMAVLELEDPIGASTGWVSIGFNTNESELTDGIFYKFTYPVRNIPFTDTNEYTGDILYYNYGKVDSVEENYLGITGTSGASGESGSSILKVTNGEEYTTYGVLSTAINLRHSKINNWKFYALKGIIENDLVLNVPSANTKEKFTLFPNPVADKLYLKSEKEIVEFVLFDTSGKKVLFSENSSRNYTIDISNVWSGIYYLQLTTNTSVTIKKIIKL